MKFDYLDKKKGMMQTARIAKSLHTRKMEEINIEPYLMEEFNPELIKEFLNQMTLSNLMVFAESKDF